MRELPAEDDAFAAMASPLQLLCSASPPWRRGHGSAEGDDRRQRGGGPRSLPNQRSDRDLSDHPLVDDGRAGGPVGEPAPPEPLGHRATRGRDAERGGGGR